MYALRIELPHDSLHLTPEAYDTVLHVDKAVQAEPPPDSDWWYDRVEAADAAAAADAEVAAATSSGPPLDPGQSHSEDPSPFLPAEAEEAELAVADEDDAAELEADAAAVEAYEIERMHVPFFAGNPQAELIAGSIGFFRFAQPGGTLGLRPPPIRSNLICLLAVPPSLSSPELIGFLGGFMRYVRHMRLVREASPPHGSLLLLQFGTPATAEAFRRAYHGKRYNSLEPDVAVAVHVAQVDLVPSTPRAELPAPTVHLSLDLGTDEPASSAGGSSSEPASSADAPPEPVGLPDSAAAAAAAAAERIAAVTAATQTPPSEASASTEAAPEVAPEAAPAAAAADDARADAPREVRVRARMSVEAARRNLRPPPLPPQPVPPAAQEALALARSGRRAPIEPLPLGGLLGASTELPSCAVCLERLDPSVSGIYTLLCTHSFHSSCLRRWQDSSCPVCRHVQEEAAETQSTCEACGSRENIWICLVCGHVGCGRYGCGAGLHHNHETSHNFAMELSTQRVWDYAGDNYVHRLIQNKVDGKLVELPDPGNRGGASSGLGMGMEGLEHDGFGGAATTQDRAALEMKQRNLENECEAVEQEYSTLLAGQLEAQRAHYESTQAQLLAEVREAFETRIAKAEASEARSAQQESLARELTKRLADRERRLKAIEEEKGFETTLNEQLRRNQGEHASLLEAAQAREAALRAKLQDMEEQLRDLTFHFEAQLKIAHEGGGAAEGELAGGSVEVPATPPQRGKGKAKRRSGS